VVVGELSVVELAVGVVVLGVVTGTVKLVGEGISMTMGNGCVIGG
jgi:hypothetical protein